MSDIIEVNSEDHLVSILKDTYNIPVELWGKGKAKTCKQLYDEIVKGESVLIKVGDKFERCVTVLNIFVTDPESRILIEEKQIFKDSRVRERNIPLAEKMLPDEDWLTAGVRAIKEELGSILPDTEHIIKIDEASHRIKSNISQSGSYPECISRYSMHYCKAYIEGLPSTNFETYEDHLTSYWTWVAPETHKSFIEYSTL